jgi:hypothetical protein
MHITDSLTVQEEEFAQLKYSDVQSRRSCSEGRSGANPIEPSDTEPGTTL